MDEVIYSASGPPSYMASMDEVIYSAPWCPWQKSAIVPAALSFPAASRWTKTVHLQDFRCLPGGPGGCDPLPFESRHRRVGADPRASGYAEEVAADMFESTVRQAQRGQEIGIHGLLEAQARRMVQGGAKTAGIARQPCGGRRTTTTSHWRRVRARP